MIARAALLLSTLAAPVAVGAVAPGSAPTLASSPVSTPGSVSASSPMQKVGADTIVQTVEAELRARLQAVGRTQASVKVAGRIDDQALPLGALSTEVGEIAGRWPRARAALPVRLRVDGAIARTLTVWVESRDLRTVPTYSADYPARRGGDAIALASAQVDMNCCAGESLPSSEAVQSLRLKRSVRAGQAAMAADFESIPDVQAQQPVRIDVARGAVRLSVSGVALRDGRIGERVPVRADDGERTVVSRVTGKHKVQVDE